MAGGSRFRLPYKRQKYYHRKNRDWPQINTHVQSLVNPFDTKNGQPKWPDGLATYSIGRRHQLTSEIYCENFYVLLFPGAINWCVAFAPVEDRVELHANHTANISINYEFNETGEELPGATDALYEYHTAHDSFSHWRNVTTAVHMQVINTTDANEGWFRAVRINRQREFQTFFDVIAGYGSQYGNGNHVMQTPHLHVGGLLPSTNLINKLQLMFQSEPSFCCGELQDIHNAVFQLNMIKENNEFKKLKTETVLAKLPKKAIYKRDDPVSLSENWAAEFEYGKIGANFKNERSEWGFLSDNKDIILVQILGGPNTKILLHSVNNQEFLVPDNSQLTQYNTPCQYDREGLNRYNDNRSNYHKYPYHYLTNLEQTEKALPGPYYRTEPWHYFG